MTTCRKDDLTREEKLVRHEQKILTECRDFMPASLMSILSDHFNEVRNRDDHGSYLDSLESSIDKLMMAVAGNVSSDEYKKVLDDSFSDFLTKGTLRCAGLGYVKGIKADASLSGEVGTRIIAGLQASGGGGIKAIYDFVNLDRQVYYYSFCSNSYAFETETCTILGSGTGFTGINEIVTGIKYLDNNSRAGKFEGGARADNYSPVSGLAEFFGAGSNPFLGTSSKTMADFSGIGNLGSCPRIMIPIDNAIKIYSFKVPGSLPESAATELTLAYSGKALVSYTTGVTETYIKFDDDRPLAGFRMAEELLNESPLPGLTSSPANTDVTASAIALIYGLSVITGCPSELPSIGTRPVNTYSNTTAECGGIVTDDRGSWIKVRGVIWNDDPDPDWDNKLGFTKDGQGTGQYASTIHGLSPNTTYYVRAYATNNAGTGYGESVILKTTSIPNFTPLQPLYPSPASGSTDVSISPVLSWNCTDPDDEPLKYDIYLDTSNPPTSLLSSDQNSPAFQLNGLSNGTRYFWKIVAKDDHSNTTEGDVWSFTTENPTLVNTFGAGNSYLPGHGWLLGYSGNEFYVHAIGFIPVASGNVSRYKIAVLRNSEGSKLDAILLSDSDNRPGAVIEKFSFVVPAGIADLMISAVSLNHPRLTAGTRYWLAVAPTDRNSGIFAWYRNPYQNGVFNAIARSWNLDWITCEDAGYTPALRIEGMAE